MDLHLLGGRPLYFPFLSGILRYECQSCDARCCKGAQLGIGRSRELAGLLHVLPGLALFATEGFPQGPLPLIDTPLEHCWFLDSSRMCRLERNAGREHKPTGCRLFPFNQFRSAGDFLVVMPHFMCPLTVTPNGDAAESSHDALTQEMVAVGMTARGHPELPRPGELAWNAVLALERRIRDLGSAHLESGDYCPYADAQADLTARSVRGVRGPSASALQAEVARVLGMGPARPSAPLVRQLVALTPYLRLRVAAGSRDLMPRMLTAFSALAAVLEGMQGAVVTPRTLVHMWEKRAPLLVTLGRLLDRPVLDDAYSAESLAGPRTGAPEMLSDLVFALEANARSAVPQSLGAILAAQEAMRPPLAPAAVAVLARLGRYLGEAVRFV